MSPSPPSAIAPGSPKNDELNPPVTAPENQGRQAEKEEEAEDEGAGQSDNEEADEKVDEEPTTIITTASNPPLPNEQPPLPPGPAPAAVHQKNDWAAIWSPEASKYYFHNSQTNTTTWDNPLAPPTSASTTPTATTSATPTPSSSTLPPSTSPPLPPNPSFGGIDPDLAYLDPSLARFASAGSSAPSFAASFNAKTGRFQAGGPREGGVVSRQEEHYYDAKGWRESLEGKGLAAIGRGGVAEGAGGEEGGGGRKRPSAKEVERFKAEKAEKKRRKLSAWLGK